MDCYSHDFKSSAAGRDASSVCFSYLLPELILEIAKYLTLQDLNSLLRTSRRFEEILTPELCKHINNVDEYGETPLQSAARLGQPHLVMSLIEKGAELPAPDWCLLHHVCSVNDPACVRRLLLLGQDMHLADKDGYGRTPLHDAIQNDCFDVVQVILDNSADISAQDKHGETALHLAARGGNVALVKDLVRRGADISKCNFHYSTPLHYAALLGRTPVVEFLMEAGADVCEERYRTVVHRAVRGGYWNIVELLTQAGADLSAEGLLEGASDRSLDHFCDPYAEGREDIIPCYHHPFEFDWPVTALLYAVKDRGEDLVRRLLNCGMTIAPDDYNIRVVVYHWTKWARNQPPALLDVLTDACPDLLNDLPVPLDSTALHWAAKHGFEERVRTLIEAADAAPRVRMGTGMDCLDPPTMPFIEAAKHGHSPIVQMFLDQGADPSIVDSHNRSGLFWASMNGREDVVRILLEAGADTTQRDDSEETVLCVAARFGHVDVIRRLLGAGADASVVDTDTGYTPLESALSEGHYLASRVLMEHSADGGEISGTILHAAAVGGNPDAVRLVLDRGATVDFLDYGRTPLGRAAMNREANSIKVLLEAGADVNAADVDGDTPLHWTAGNIDCMELLLSAGADVDRKNALGQTALHYAAKHDDRECVRILVHAGSDTAAKDGAGRTPLDLAKEGELTAVVELLTGN